MYKTELQPQQQLYVSTLILIIIPRGLFLKLLRGATDIVQLCNNDVYTGSAIALRVAGVGTTYLDSPATTSATTYKTQFYAFNSITAYVQQTASRSTITLMEIAA